MRRTNTLINLKTNQTYKIKEFIMLRNWVELYIVDYEMNDEEYLAIVAPPLKEPRVYRVNKNDVANNKMCGGKRLKETIPPVGYEWVVLGE